MAPQKKLTSGNQSPDSLVRLGLAPTINNDSVAEAKKFNQNHDEAGRFATANSNSDIQLAATTNDFKHACRVLGLDPKDATKALHAAKETLGLGGADNSVFDLDTGDIL